MQLNRILFPIIVLFTLLCNATISQTVCTINGQYPSSAFPVCGTSVFVQDSVGSCGNFPVPVRPCLGDGYTYTDINPYWYKFTCFKTGTLSLLLTPNNLTDDYDWQLFDITGHPFADIYTDSSLIVGCNWSGNTGTTGADSTGLDIFNCGGIGYPNISAMPTIIQGHQYVLLVSHFTSTDQSGYQLTFGTGGGTAVITDTLTPNYSTVALKCSGSAIGIKLNKPMLCSSMAANGSNFSISTNPTIDSVVGHGCRYGFDMDSITIYLAAALDTGRYILTTQPDNTGGNISDICNTGIPVGEKFGLTRVIPQPTRMDSITTPLPCAPQQLQLVFKVPMLCSSVAADGSQFYITGPSNVVVSGATTNCDSNGVASVIYVNLANPITTDGIYTIHLKKGTNFTTLIDECTTPTPPDSLKFKAIDSVSAAFNINTKLSCLKDTIRTKYLGVSSGTINTTSWQWTLDNNAISTDTNLTLVDSTFKPKNLQLTVSNGSCSNVYALQITPLDHSMAIGVTVSANTLCPSQSVTFTDTSFGTIAGLKTYCYFGDGRRDSASAQFQHQYPLVDSQVTYKDTFVVANQVGCHDTAFNNITVKSAMPPIVDSIVKDTCGTSRIHIFFQKPIQCSSLDSDGSNFTLVKLGGLKLDTIPIVNATVLSCVNNLGNEVAINLGYYTAGQFNLSIHIDSNGNKILDECNIASTDTILPLSTPFTIAADFYDSIRVGCNRDTLYAFDSCKAATAWLWTFDSTQTSTSPTPVFVFGGITPKSLFLKASNPYCSASDTFTIIPLPHNITVAFTTQDTLCPNVAATFTNNSVGSIIKWDWNFGDGTKSNIPSPSAVNYPSIDTFKTYTVSLIEEDIYGCIDTTQHAITIKPGSPSLIDTIVPLPCAPKLVELTFNHSYQCSSLSADGSNFYITGPSNVVIDSAASICTNGLSDTVQLFFASPIVVSGQYNVKIQKASNGSQLLNGCNVASTIGNALNFTALDAVDAHFAPIVQYGCKIDTITYAHNNLNGIDKWNWTFFNTNDTFYSNNQDTSIVYIDLSPKKVQLVVSNNICSDTYDTTIILPNETDTIKAGFTIQKHDDGTIQASDFVCPIEEAIFTDTSIGKINSWFWNFGDNQTSSVQDPLPQLYPHNDTIVNYLVQLIIKGNYCYDTASKYIKVIPNCYIDVPTAFTPNGDGKNDYLYPLNAWKADNLLFRVYNRYGQLVFETRDWTRKWNGSTNGGDPMVGTYIWTLDYIDHDTQLPVHKNGTTVLIR